MKFKNGPVQIRGIIKGLLDESRLFLIFRSFSVAYVHAGRGVYIRKARIGMLGRRSCSAGSLLKPTSVIYVAEFSLLAEEVTVVGLGLA